MATAHRPAGTSTNEDLQIIMSEAGNSKLEAGPGRDLAQDSEEVVADPKLQIRVLQNNLPQPTPTDGQEKAAKFGFGIVQGFSDQGRNAGGSSRAQNASLNKEGSRNRYPNMFTEIPSQYCVFKPKAVSGQPGWAAMYQCAQRADISRKEALKSSACSQYSPATHKPVKTDF